MNDYYSGQGPSQGGYPPQGQPGQMPPQQYGAAPVPPEAYGQSAQYGQQAQYGQGAAPVPPQAGQQQWPGAPTPTPTPTPRPRVSAVGTRLDWVRDIAGPVLLILSLVMVWLIDAAAFGQVRLTAVVIAPVLTVVVAVLGGIAQLLARFGMLPVSPQLAHLIRIGSQAPFLITLLVYVVLDIVGGFAPLSVLEGRSGPGVFGVGAGAAIGLLGALLTIQPRDYELQALGGLGSQQGRLMALIDRILGFVLAGIAALGLVLTVVIAVITMSEVAEYGSAGMVASLVLNLLAVLVLTAALVGLPLALHLLGSEPGRLLALGTGIAAALAVLLDGTFGLAFSKWGIESVLEAGYLLLVAPALAALAISPIAFANRRPIDRTERWFSAIGLGFLVVAATGFAYLLSAIGRLVLGSQSSGVGSAVAVLILSLLAIAGAVVGYLALRSRRDTTKQLVLVIIAAAVAVLGLVVAIVAAVSVTAAFTGMSGIIVGEYAFAGMFLLGVVLAVALIVPAEVKQFFVQRGLGLQLPAAGAPGQFGAPQGGYGQPGQPGPHGQPGPMAPAGAAPMQPTGAYDFGQGVPPAGAAPVQPTGAYDFGQGVPPAGAAPAQPTGAYDFGQGVPPAGAAPVQPTGAYDFGQGAPSAGAAPVPPAGASAFASPQAHPHTPMHDPGAPQSGAHDAGQATAAGAEQYGAAAGHRQPGAADSAFSPETQAPGATEHSAESVRADGPVAAADASGGAPDLAALARRALDPSTPAAELTPMTAHRELWPYLAAAPAASPDLLDWLATTGDPTVQQYLDARGHRRG